MKIYYCLSVALSVLSTISCKSILRPESIPYGITLRHTKERFSIFTDGSAASNIEQDNDNGSVSWIATAAGGGGGGVSFYMKYSQEEINIANYDSMELELDYSPVEGKWNADAKNPGFCIRILPWDSTGIFGGYEDLEFFDTEEYSGTVERTFKIPSSLAEKIKKTSDFDSVLGFGIKFNDYMRGNSDGDQLQVTLKNVKFNAKEDAVEDTPFDDGLTPEQHGTVESIYYPTRDYTVDEAELTDADRYEKHAWVYLPAGYDAEDKDTEYPVFVLLHGIGQNENTWGLSDKGRGGKIKGYMDRGMASGKVEKFILVVVTEIASKSWGPNGAGNDVAAANAFGGELRNDLLPYLRANFNIKEGRDNVAMAGLSMGGGLTYSIGIGESLDLISNFAVFSGRLARENEDTAIYEFIERLDNTPELDGLKIHNFYMTCGDADFTIFNKYHVSVDAMTHWDRVENIKEYTYPGGTHDFPVWYNGFHEFIEMVFKPAPTTVTASSTKKCTVKTIKKCKPKTL